MASPIRCEQNRDPLLLMREGTNQQQRFLKALDPTYALVDERKPADNIVFTQVYAAFLKYYDVNNVAVDDWSRFFIEDVSVKLAAAAVADVEYYRVRVKVYFDYLNNIHNNGNSPELKDCLGCLFSCVGTLAWQLDVLKEGLSNDIQLKGTLQKLIQTKLATALNRLITYYKADHSHLIFIDTVPSPELRILGNAVISFNSLATANLSKDWITENSLATDWAGYYTAIGQDGSVYGDPGGTLFEKVNHIATHNLFTSIFDEFLKAYARTTIDAEVSLQKTFTAWDRHKPHYALFLAFLHLFEYARAEINTLTARHLDFYYRTFLQLKEKSAEPCSVHLLVELAKQAVTHEIKSGELFKAGKDDKGIDAFFANDADFVANKAVVTAFKTVFRNNDGRFYASPVANSADGLGAELTTVDKSWHPFFNGLYKDGSLSEIKMPEAKIGFAIASHYLLMAEGIRTITVDLTVKGSLAGFDVERKNSLVCLLTSEKGWIKKEPSTFTSQSQRVLRMKIELEGSDPAVTPYTEKVHRYNLQTTLPVLMVIIRQTENEQTIYPDVVDFALDTINLQVDVSGLKTLAVSNDFGSVDTSKPFQPFGPSPVEGSSLIIGSKEIFQKKLTEFSISLVWQITPVPYNSTTLKIKIALLQGGIWNSPDDEPKDLLPNPIDILNGFELPVVDEPDLQSNEYYNSASRHGFTKLSLTKSFGQADYQNNLIAYLKNDPTVLVMPTPPVIPIASELSMKYRATQTIELNSIDTKDFSNRTANFFHIAPFGLAEQHPYLKAGSIDTKIYLFPHLKNEAEFYIGVADLALPQNLSLLFQIVDGSSNPDVEKQYIQWSYLSNNEWIPFTKNEVADHTNCLLNSGIITFAMPREVSNTNTILPSGLYWIRATVDSESDAVCRLLKVAAQALKATFIHIPNDPAFPAKVLKAGTISKLDEPSSDVKSIIQPFASFGGRGAEIATAFNTRISERLRHKDRAIAMWDYERLVLEAFPQIYKVKCLNHTWYECTESGSTYRELAPGHVTIVTIPNQQFQNWQDPLRPFTSSSLLKDIDAFLGKRLSCFTNLHVKNPLFEEVKVSFKVRLKAGCDESYSVVELQNVITRFLSPWAFAGGGNPSFGGKIYKSALINFVEDQKCVDYVIDFELQHTYLDADGNTREEKKDEVEGSRSISILVSAREHDIDSFTSAKQETHLEQCPCQQ